MPTKVNGVDLRSTRSTSGASTIRSTSAIVMLVECVLSVLVVRYDYYE